MVTFGTLICFVALCCLTIGFDAFIYQINAIEAIRYLYEDFRLGKLYNIVFCLIGLGFAIWSDYKGKKTQKDA